MKVALSIGGSDSCGGAGIQADSKTFHDFGIYSTTALTAITAQNTTGVKKIILLQPEDVIAQIDAVCDDFPIDVIKIGMLMDKQIIEAVACRLRFIKAKIVFDPVCISKAGSVLLAPDAIDALRRMVSLVDIVTPNRYEASILFGDDVEAYAKQTPIVVKNLVDPEDPTLRIDRLYHEKGMQAFPHPTITTNNLHGTGCTFAAALAASWICGSEMTEALVEAQSYVSSQLRSAMSVGGGFGPISFHGGSRS